MKRNCSSSATSEEEVVISIGVVSVSSLILRRIFSVTLSVSLEKKSAAVLIEPYMCAFSKLYCNTYSHAFQSARGVAFVWKKRATDLLSVMTSVFLASHRMRANSRNAIWIAKNSFEYMDILNCAAEKIFEPFDTGCTFSVLIVLSDRDCLQS